MVHARSKAHVLYTLSVDHMTVLHSEKVRAMYTCSSNKRFSVKGFTVELTATYIRACYRVYI